MGFIDFSLIDLVDIILVSLILLQVYRLIRGTVVINIFVAIILLYATYLIARTLNMELMSMMLGQFIGVGFIALIILFQQEIRRFLLHLGTNYMNRRSSIFMRWLFRERKPSENKNVSSIVTACREMAKDKTGALIVLASKASMQLYAETGVVINAEISPELLMNIFFKNSPLHDGAVLISDNKIHAARCILPTTESQNIPGNFGTRHRAAIGITELTNAETIVVSEETGAISYVKNGTVQYKITPEKLQEILQS